MDMICVVHAERRCAEQNQSDETLASQTAQTDSGPSALASQGEVNEPVWRPCSRRYWLMARSKSTGESDFLKKLCPTAYGKEGRQRDFCAKPHRARTVSSYRRASLPKRTPAFRRPGWLHLILPHS